MNDRNKYHFYKKELSRLLQESRKISWYNDTDIIDRIINYLSEGKSVQKIVGIIRTAEIVTYGGDITIADAEYLYQKILEWWNRKNEDTVFAD